MGQNTRDRLVQWLEQTVKRDYVGKVALVCLYGSHINGTANEQSDVDCYFVPKTEAGMTLARTFLLEGVGYDIYPAPWERLERIAALKDSHQPLVGDVQVLYADSAQDLARLEALQQTLRTNLADPIYRQQAAENRWREGRAGNRLPAADWPLKDSRMLAGCLLMNLAEKLAFARGTYYHYGLKRQFADLLALESLPPQLRERYLAVIQAGDSAAVREACERLLACCGCAAEEHEGRLPWGEMPVGMALAGLYEEISSSFRKIEVCAGKKDPVLAFLTAVCLQWEVPEVDLLTDFCHENLADFAQKTLQKEQLLRQKIAQTGGVLKEYATFEAFEQAQ